MAHLQKVLGNVSSIVMVASSKKVGKHALKCQLLQQEICFPLTTQKLMDKQSRLDEVVNPVLASWVLSACLKVVSCTTPEMSWGQW